MTIRNARRLHDLLLTLKRDEGDDSKKAAGDALALVCDEHEFSRVPENMFLITRQQTGAVFLKFVQWLATHGRLVQAATILWTSDQFTAEPESVRRIWDALGRHHFVSLLGSSAQGKSFSPSVYLLLQWLSDPDWTRVDLVSTNEGKLKSALYAKIVNLHANATLPLPGLVNSESISLNSKAQFGLFCVLIKKGAESAGELKGFHKQPRAKPHPVFGATSRRFVMIDEAQEVPDNTYQQIGNVLSSRGGVNDGATHVQIILTANPKNMNSRYGANCKPVQGWEYAQDKFEWMSATNALCICLDARESENIKKGRVVYDGFQTKEGMADMLAQCWGDPDHPDMWTYVYGRFPPNGPYTSIITARWLNAAEGEWQFTGPTIPVAGADIAREGGDSPALASGRAGQASGWCNIAGHEFKLPEPRWVIQLDVVVQLPNGDTGEVADEIMARCRALGVKPENLAVDITGLGVGVYDTMRDQWNRKVNGVKSTDMKVHEKVQIIGVNYSNSASEMKITEEDSRTPKEMFDRMATELWYVAAKLYELDVVRNGRGVDQKTLEELVSRRGGSIEGKGKKKTLETKKAHKSRVGKGSPDRGDATTLFLHAARMSCEQLRPRSKYSLAHPDPYALMRWQYQREHGKPMDESLFAHGSLAITGMDALTLDSMTEREMARQDKEGGEDSDWRSIGQD